MTQNKSQTPSYSIGVTTFVHRFDKYFKPLMTSISKMRPDIDKVVFVNGQHKKDFDQGFRKDIMEFSSTLPRTYLIMSPIVRGCSHMWNTISNHTSSDYILMLNDDVLILDGFFDRLEQVLGVLSGGNEQSFRINGSFSHFCLYRKDLFDVGYFDERLIAFGEEDGDWLWRWEVSKKRGMIQMVTHLIHNYIDQADTNSENMTKNGGKYPRFNTDWIFKNKYDCQSTELDPSKPAAVSTYGKLIQMRDNAFTPNFYPAEKWYRDMIDSV